MPRGYPGLPERLRARILEKYGSISRFTQQRKYPHVYVYRWLRGMQPTYEHFIRLCADLEMTPGELMFGEAANRIPVREDADAAATAPAAEARTTAEADEAFIRNALKRALPRLPPETGEKLVATIMRRVAAQPTRRAKRR